MDKRVVRTCEMCLGKCYLRNENDRHICSRCAEREAVEFNRMLCSCGTVLRAESARLRGLCEKCFVKANKAARVSGSRYRKICECGKEFFTLRVKATTACPECREARRNMLERERREAKDGARRTLQRMNLEDSTDAMREAIRIDEANRLKLAMLMGGHRGFVGVDRWSSSRAD